MSRIVLIFIFTLSASLLFAQEDVDLATDESNAVEVSTDSEVLDEFIDKLEADAESQPDVDSDDDSEEVEVTVETQENEPEDAEVEKMRRFDLGVGMAFYNDAVGLNLSLDFQMSLGDWIRIFNRDYVPSFAAQRLLLGVAGSGNIVPISFSIYSFNIGLIGSFRLKLSDFGDTEIPLSSYSYVQLGVPINAFATDSQSVVAGGFAVNVGEKIGYRIHSHFEVGVGVEYQMNFTSVYIGSLSTGIYGAFLF